MSQVSRREFLRDATLIAGSAAIGSSLTLAGSAPAVSAQTPVTLKVLSPQGTIDAVNEYAPRLKSLDGKTIALWLATPEGPKAGKGLVLYGKLSELLKKQFPNVKLIMPADLPKTYSPADEVIGKIKAVKPDGVVIGTGG